MSHLINIERIKAVANAFASVHEKVVFVGGATITFYPDQPVFESRPTDDVDVIVEILSYSDRNKLEEKLRSVGFSNDWESGILCRFKMNIENNDEQYITVDVMPTNEPLIGFTNIWYPEGFKKAVDYEIDESCSIKILSTPYFIATKLEAFKGRGKNDGRTSHDFEDIVYVLENRETIWEELDTADESVKQYLRSEFQNIKTNHNLFEWIDSHVERNSPPATYFIMDELEKFTR